jgi:hypothetical protein
MEKISWPFCSSVFQGIFIILSYTQSEWQDWAKFRRLDACVFFVQIFENYISCPYFCAIFFQIVMYILILIKIGWATFWAIFKNSSGHPVHNRHLCLSRKVPICLQIIKVSCGYIPKYVGFNATKTCGACTVPLSTAYFWEFVSQPKLYTIF